MSPTDASDIPTPTDALRVLYTKSGMRTNHATDGKYVYIHDEWIPGADPATFEVLGDFAKDAQHVYFGREVIGGADPASFEPFGANLLIARDAAHVYCSMPGTEPGVRHMSALEGLDPHTTKLIGDSYLVDAEQVYSLYMTRTISADARTFTMSKLDESLGEGIVAWYAQDNTRVYLHGQVVEGADSATFIDCGIGYGKDAEHVYCNGAVLQGADAKTFKVPGYQNFSHTLWDAEDAHQRYFQGAAIIV